LVSQDTIAAQLSLLGSQSSDIHLQLMMVHFNEHCFLAECLLLLALLVHLVLLARAMNAGLRKIEAGSMISHPTGAMIWIRFTLIIGSVKRVMVGDFDLTQMTMSSLLVQDLQER
jgi:hypothetical protein